MPPEGAPRAAWVSYLGRVHALWGAWGVRMYGWGESVIVQREATAECLDRNRDDGLIR